MIISNIYQVWPNKTFPQRNLSFRTTVSRSQTRCLSGKCGKEFFLQVVFLLLHWGGISAPWTSSFSIIWDRFALELTPESRAMGSRGPGGSCPRNTQKRGGTSSHCHCGTDSMSPPHSLPCPQGCAHPPHLKNAGIIQGRGRSFRTQASPILIHLFSKIKSLFCTSHAHG